MDKGPKARECLGCLGNSNNKGSGVAGGNSVGGSGGDEVREVRGCGSPTAFRRTIVRTVAFTLSKMEIHCRVLKKLYTYPECSKVPVIWLYQYNLEQT